MILNKITSVYMEHRNEEFLNPRGFEEESILEGLFSFSGLTSITEEKPLNRNLIEMEATLNGNVMEVINNDFSLESVAGIANATNSLDLSRGDELHQQEKEEVECEGQLNVQGNTNTLDNNQDEVNSSKMKGRKRKRIDSKLYHWNSVENSKIMKAMISHHKVPDSRRIIRQKGFWQIIAENIGSKDAKQCRSHWQRVEQIKYLETSQDQRRLRNTLEGLKATDISKKLLQEHGMNEFEFELQLDNLLNSLNETMEKNK